MKKILRFLKSELGYVIPIWLILILWIIFFCLEERRRFVKIHPPKISKPTYYKDAKRMSVESSLGIQHLYDSCDCVLLILPNGKHTTIIDDRCDNVTKKLHYTDSQILAIWKYLYQQQLNRKELDL